jgi:hypothetical protein
MFVSKGIRHSPVVVFDLGRAWCNVEATQIEIGWQSHVKVEKTFRAQEIQIPPRIPLLMFKLRLGSQLWGQDGVRQILFFFKKLEVFRIDTCRIGTLTLQEP